MLSPHFFLFDTLLYPNSASTFSLLKSAFSPLDLPSMSGSSSITMLLDEVSNRKNYLQDLHNMPQNVVNSTLVVTPVRS